VVPKFGGAAGQPAVVTGEGQNHIGGPEVQRGAVGRQLVQRHEFPSGFTHVVSIVQVAVSVGQAPTACSGVQNVAFGDVTCQRADEQVACVSHASPRGSSPQPQERPSCVQAAPSTGGCPGQGETVAPPLPEAPTPALPPEPPEPVPEPAAPSDVAGFNGVPPHSANIEARISEMPNEVKLRILICPPNV
jgi:hypothetical protein